MDKSKKIDLKESMIKGGRGQIRTLHRKREIEV